MQDAQDAFDGHRLAGARAADDHGRGLLVDRQIDAVQHHLGAEAFLDADQFDLGRAVMLWNRSAVRMKLAARIRIEDDTTASVVARAHALRAALGIEAVIAAHQRDDEAEHRRLDQAGGDVLASWRNPPCS